MKLKPWQKNILSSAIVIVVGLALLLAAFLLLALIARGARVLLPGEGGNAPALSRIALLVLTLLLLPFVFRSKLPDPFKAAYLTLPLMTGLMLLGIALYGKPLWTVLVSGGAVIAAALAYLAVRKKPWLYFFAVAYVAALALYVYLSGMQL